jgi:hypothetical protein
VGPGGGLGEFEFGQCELPGVFGEGIRKVNKRTEKRLAKWVRDQVAATGEPREIVLRLIRENPCAAAHACGCTIDYALLWAVACSRRGEIEKTPADP